MEIKKFFFFIFISLQFFVLNSMEMHKEPDRPIRREHHHRSFLCDACICFAGCPGYHAIIFMGLAWCAQEVPDMLKQISEDYFQTNHTKSD